MNFICKCLNRLGVLKYFCLVAVTEYGENNFKIPIIKGMGFSNLYLTEIWMIELLQKLLPQGKGVFIDVGVNLGQTLLKLKSVNNDIDYVGFEPNSTCAFYVDQLINENNFSNTKVIPVGILDRNGISRIDFYGQNETDSSASMIESFRPDQSVQKTKYVPVVDFESIRSIISLNNVSIIKIDVEGAEYEVLKSMVPIISEYRPSILIEILPVYNDTNVLRLDRQNNIEKMMIDLNYYIYRIIKSDKDYFVSMVLILEIGIHSDLSQCDYLFSPVPLTTEDIKQ